ncbi:hypothetical protein GCM10007377_01420 [Galliscardovia ingluviei]|uniref:Restriction endonuclease type IV Mrr domain-containing protein n=1 Tax=Galliscardovia ingluviei TaxID=1769422 RepID=A0A8J3EUY6_9BIFI|nr:hypothetical protein [Galliscardovia ingluviei]GGI12530.1 hypothetical protein GCM10007377_01420 [Galliscardovia ingluviei]
MPGRIPWERISGDDVETIIAVFICRENPEAMRIRPSRGDGGIDLLCKRDDGSYDVYQVKKFATNLSNSHKSQIVNSWRRVQEYCRENQMTICNWYLVLPLDPTLENRTWFKTTIEDCSSFKCHWYGLTNIEAWASAMPEVYDYYMADGKEEINRQIKMILEAAQESDLRDQNELTKKLFTYAELLSSTDPNYAYTIRAISKYDKNNPLFITRPGLVYSSSITNSEGYSVVIDVIAKYTAATEFAPLKESFTLYADTSEKKQELLDFIQYGTPFTELSIQNIKGTLFKSLIEEAEDVISSSIRLLKKTDPHPTSFILVSDDTHVVLKQVSRTSGQTGIEWVGKDESQLIHVRLRTEKDTLHTTLELSVDFDSLSGSDVSAAFCAVRFLYAVSRSQEIELDTIDGDTIYANQGVRLFDEEVINEWYSIISSLKTIYDSAFGDFRCPDFKVVKMTDVKRWKEIEYLLSDELVIRHWDTMTFVQDSDTCVNFPAGVCIFSKLKAIIGTDEIFLGYSQQWLNATSITYPTTSKEECVLHSSPEIGDLLVERRITLKNEDKKKASRVFIGPLLDMSAYAQYITSD